MKNNKLTLIISLIALVGVIFLLIHEAGEEKNESKPAVSQQNIKSKIAFVNVDSVLVKYDLYNELSLQLAKKQQDLDKQLKSKALSLQNRAYQLQQKYAQHLITTETYQNKAQKLTQEQTQLQQWQQKKANELSEDQMNLTQRVYDSIISAVNTVNANKKYDYIISNAASGGSTLLYGNPDFDITNEVVKIMNSRVSLTDSATTSK
jgi:outer membrane protein